MAIDQTPSVAAAGSSPKIADIKAALCEPAATGVDDVTFWTKHSYHAISSLVKNSGTYSEEEQAAHLQFFKDIVIPNLGPQPTLPMHKYEMVTHNGSPIEFSYNFSTASETPAVRFSYEPKGTYHHLSKPLGAYMNWFEQLAAEFGPTEEEKKMVSASMPHLLQFPDQLIAVNFDKKGKRAMKAYIGPVIKEMTTGIDPNRASIDAVKRLEPRGSEFAPALDVFEQYRAKCEAPAKITMIGVDCIEPDAGARIKMYTRNLTYSYESIKEEVMLGGLRTDETTMEGLRIFRDVWDLLINEPEGSVADSFVKPERNPPSLHSGMMISWELQLGRKFPDPKIYIPLWQFADNNQTITDNLEKIFKKWGWSWGTEGKYSAAMKETFESNGPLDKDQIFHTYITFNFSSTGLYMTSYFGVPLISGA